MKKYDTWYKAIKNHSDRYLEIIISFPQRPMLCELVQQQVNRILDERQLGDEERDYLRLLEILIYEYEKRNEPAFTMAKTKVLRQVKGLD